METTTETPVIMENILFVNISATSVDPSKIEPLLEIIAKVWKLDLNNTLHRIIANRILIQSVVFN